MANKKTYSSKDIKVLKFPESIQTRPTMYISDLGVLGLIHLLRESVDNSIDEFLAGYASDIKIRIKTKDTISIEVEDNGRGIPIDDKKKFNSIFTSTHSGGKFDNESYSNSSGLNGVGLTITNALSDFLDISVKRDGKVYQAQYELGMQTFPLDVVDTTKTKKETGTTIYFEPSMELLRIEEEDLVEFKFETLRDYLQRMAFLNSGLKISLDFDDKKVTYVFKDGLQAYMDFLLGDDSFTAKKSFMVEGKEKDKTISVTFNWLLGKNQDETVESYCNSIHTIKGGTHVEGLRTGLTTAVKRYVKEKNLITQKDNLEIGELSGEDIRDGMIAIIDLKHKDPLFTAQTKHEISNKDVRKFVSVLVADELSLVFNSDPTLAKQLCRKFIENAKIRKSGKLAKEKINRKATSSMSSTKLSDCTGKNPKDLEIYILEGDSASGSAKQAREIEYQAIYPLRGKILNTQELGINKIIANKELSDLITILGMGVGEKRDVELLRYHKVVILTDSDVDGYHIASLLITFFFKYYPELITNGYLYIANPPLYVIKHSGTRYFAKDDKDKDQYIKKLKVKPSVTRFKGLGEMNPEELEITTMAKKSRLLTQVTLSDAEATALTFTDLMGKNAEPRKKFILENSELAIVDI